MALIIDGHNLIGIMPGIDLSDPDDEDHLLARLRGFHAASGQPLIVFFDPGGLPPTFTSTGLSGRRPVLSTTGVQVRYAQRSETADDAIVAFLKSRAQPGQYAVVTNDHDLAFRARSAGASVIPATQFLQRLVPKPARKRSGTPADNAPNAEDPAFADLSAMFLQLDANKRRFGSGAEGDPDTWLERLYGDDVAQAQNAAHWLGQHGGPDALEPLRDALTHGDARVRAAAVLALGDLGDPVALPDLAHRLLNDGASTVREAAAQVLGRTDDRSVEPALQTAADSDSKNKVRKSARAALEQRKARRSAGPHPDGR